MTDYWTRPIQSDRVNGNFGRCRKIVPLDDGWIRSEMKAAVWPVVGLAIGCLIAGGVYFGANALARTGLSPFGPSPQAVSSASPLPSLSRVSPQPQRFATSRGASPSGAWLRHATPRSSTQGTYHVQH